MQLKVVLSAVALCLALVIGCSNVDPLIGQVGGANTAPYAPYSPNPGDGAVNSLLSTDLKWAGGDKDGDSMQYYLYFGTSASNMPLVATPKNGLFDSLNDLDFATTYYWKIVANDGSATTEGPVWSFTTKSAPQVVAGWKTIINTESQNITALTFDATGALWVGTRYSGMAKYDAAAVMWSWYTSTNSGLPQYAISSISIDPVTGRKWIGTWGGGLIGWSTQKDTAFTNNVFNRNIPDNVVSSAWLSPNGDTLLIGSQFGLTTAFLPSSMRWFSAAQDSLDYTVACVAANPVNPYVKADSTVADTLKHKADSTARAQCLSSNNLSVKTFYASYNHTRIGKLSKLLAKYPQWSFLIDQAGKMWIGSANGLRIDGVALKPDTAVVKLPLSTGYGLLVVSDTMVVATYSSTVSGTLPSNSITCMADDGTKKWFGTPVGLAVLNGTTWTTYTTANSGLPSNKIQALAVGSANKIWIGTDAGLVVFDNP